ncbi:MAG: hypothetical protein LAO09_03900 [Acidobacteriia bacterium]|nr:hypothetical protein [Terriglobia bacterium]
MTRLSERALASSLFVVVLTFAVSASAQTYTELLSFDGDIIAAPIIPLTQGVDGALYGATRYGGTGDCFDGSGIGCGVVFKGTPEGGFRIIYNFQPDQNGYLPQNNLTLGPDGNLYGTASRGQGMIVRITPDGIFTIVHAFSGPDGNGLLGGLTLGTDGNFYGTTIGGGQPSKFCPNGCGTIYKVTPSGVVTTLYSFCPENYCPDGTSPRGALAEGTDGNFYGTTYGGGLYKVGTMFKVSPKGTFKLLYTFQNGNPQLYSGLMLASDGNFYGAESLSGLYRITPQGSFTQLANPGNVPNLPIEGSDRNLYGTTAQAGSPPYGNAFEMPFDGSPTTLHMFTGYPTDGSELWSGLVQHTNGIFYGITYSGGSSPCNYSYPGCGTIFSVDMGLPPFVAFLRGGGRVGKRFGVLGQGFTGTTSVLLNGTPASFVVKADTFLIVTVPAGATTGYVTVNTPSRPLTSNVPFYVKP